MPLEEYDFGACAARTMIMGIFGRHTVEAAHDHEKPPCEVRIIAPSSGQAASPVPACGLLSAW
jgi:hypothetical protein